MHQLTLDLEPALVRRAFEEAGAGRWSLDPAHWQAALARSVAGRFKAAPPSSSEVRDYVLSLQLADLALAAACVQGVPHAWDHFVLTYRPVLYRAADGARGLGDAREVADSLYGELYGLDARDDERRSLLRYYHGRASLAGWLRTVLAQRLVDKARAGRRLVPFEEAGALADEGAERVRRTVQPPRQAGAEAAGAGDPHRAAYLAAVRAALQAAIAALDPGLRLRLSLYYARGLKLMAIGRLVGESEATVSRKLDRVRRELRAAVGRELRDGHGLSAAEVALALEYAAGDETFDLREVLPEPDS